MAAASIGLEMFVLMGEWEAAVKHFKGAAMLLEKRNQSATKCVYLNLQHV